MTRAGHLKYDLFTGGRWQGMASGVDLVDAQNMVRRSRPDLGEAFTLVPWYGRNHHDNCKTSGGNRADPKPEAL